MARVSKASEQPEYLVAAEEDGWEFGRNRRDVGSLQVDQLCCSASDLARRNLIAVHPVAGWWKTKGFDNPEQRIARFALIVEIDAGSVDAELYAEVAVAVEALTAAQIQV